MDKGNGTDWAALWELIAHGARREAPLSSEALWKMQAMLCGLILVCLANLAMFYFEVRPMDGLMGSAHLALSVTCGLAALARLISWRPAPFWMMPAVDLICAANKRIKAYKMQLMALRRPMTMAEYHMIQRWSTEAPSA